MLFSYSFAYTVSNKINNKSIYTRGNTYMCKRNA